MTTVALIAAGAAESRSAVGARMTSFARGLSKLGWCVDVIDVGRNAPSRYQEAIERRLPQRVRAWLDAAGVEGDVMPSVWWQGRPRTHEVRADVAVVSVPPFSLLGTAGSLAKRGPVVIDYRDPWSARHRAHLLGRLTRRAESAAAQRASMVTFAGHAVLGEILASKLALPDDRVIHLPNGVDADVVPRVRRQAPERPVDGSPLDLVFVGHWYGRNGPGILADALADVGPDVARLTTIGSVSPSIDAELRSALGDGYSPIGPLTGIALHERIWRADAALITLDCSSAVESRIPTKVYNYLSVGVPIIAVCPADSAVLSMSEAAQFHHVDFRNTAGLVEILTAASVDRSLLARERIAPSIHSRDAQTKVLRDVIMRCMSEGD